MLKLKWFKLFFYTFQSKFASSINNMVTPPTLMCVDKYFYSWIIFFVI